MTSDRVYRWRLLLEEYGPEIIYIKGIHNTVADAISRLEMIPRTIKQQKQNWMIRTKLWCRTQCSHTIRKQKLTFCSNLPMNYLLQLQTQMLFMLF